MTHASKDERPTVLVVNDDPEELTSDCRTLREEFLVLAATCGEDALRMAKKALPSVIVLDVMMPGGTDGFTVFRELQNDATTHNIPVIFLTAVNRATGLSFGSRDIGQQLSAEPAAFLEKPVSPKKLLQTVAVATHIQQT